MVVSVWFDKLLMSSGRLILLHLLEEQSVDIFFWRLRICAVLVRVMKILVEFSVVELICLTERRKDFIRRASANL